ncbi:CGA synthase-related protein [Streptomyces puniciscabiei]|uniref:CGA synthase-related protein n=1 Tax=Streptomyces puniciscabiei TaxID=164348 RepID=A0A542UEG7_9ACTN|nr:CGA synthase-related protein [Streptomyces puniciscabiei]TQK97460.1 CGA synthase-related protein [Streptomyces puniciscabiei]
MSSPTTAPHPAPPRLRVLATARPALESQAALRHVSAHLTEVELTGQPDAGPAPGAAVVCDDDVLAARLSASGVPVVFVASGGPPPGDTWPPSAVRCLHQPGWLGGQRAKGVHNVGTIAPPRAARARAARGAVVQLSTPDLHPDDHAAVARAGATLRAAVEAAQYDGKPLLGVVLDAPVPARSALLSAAGEDAGALPVAGVEEAATERLLAEASLLVTSPLLTAVNQAHAARVPLLLLPALDAHQASRLAGITDAAGVEVLDAAAPDASADRAVRGADPLWSRVSRALEHAGDDRRGAQRVARQVRQLLLAPF